MTFMGVRILFHEKERNCLPRLKYEYVYKLYVLIFGDIGDLASFTL